jgi:hypothetical protein
MRFGPRQRSSAGLRETKLPAMALPNAATLAFLDRVFDRDSVALETELPLALQPALRTTCARRCYAAVYGANRSYGRRQRSQS